MAEQINAPAHRRLCKVKPVKTEVEKRPNYYFAERWINANKESKERVHIISNL